MTPHQPLTHLEAGRQFQRILQSQGLHSALGFLNARTPHRFTGSYRFDGDTLRNVALFDRWDPSTKQGADAPMEQTFCAIVGRQERSLEVLDGSTDERFPWMADNAVLSYCGALIQGQNGPPLGTICHFDVQRCQTTSAEIPLLETCGELLFVHLMSPSPEVGAACAAGSHATPQAHTEERDSLEAELEQLLVATSDYGDDGLPANLQEVLRVLRTVFKMDVVFVSKIADGKRTFMAVDASPEHQIISPGQSDPVEQSWCHNIVQGRLPELIRDGKTYIESGQAPYTPLEIGTHISVPIVLTDGSVYGTLCTFAFHVDKQIQAIDVSRLRTAARLIASRKR